MSSDFLPSFASCAAISLVAEASPNCSTRTPGWARLDGGHGGERLLDELLDLLVRAGQLEVHDDRAAVLGDVLARSAGSSGLSISVTPSIRSRRLTTSRTAAVTCRIAGLDRALALHEHLLAGLLGEAGGLDDHVAALGLAAARRRLVEVVLADLAADDGGEDDEQDPAEDGGLAVLGAPSTGACCEVARLHLRLLRRGFVRCKKQPSLYTVRCRKWGKPNQPMSRSEPATEPRAPLSRERVLRDRRGARRSPRARVAVDAQARRRARRRARCRSTTTSPTRSELIDGMIDIVFGEIEPPSTRASTGRRRCAGGRSPPARRSAATAGRSARWRGARPRAGEPPAPQRRARVPARGRLLAGDDRPRLLRPGRLHLRLRAPGDATCRPRRADDFAAEAQRQMDAYEAVLARLPPPRRGGRRPRREGGLRLRHRVPVRPRPDPRRARQAPGGMRRIAVSPRRERRRRRRS